jgi:hypothetical protein
LGRSGTQAHGEAARRVSAASHDAVAAPSPRPLLQSWGAQAAAPNIRTRGRPRGQGSSRPRDDEPPLPARMHRAALDRAEELCAWCLSWWQSPPSSRCSRSATCSSPRAIPGSSRHTEREDRRRHDRGREAWLTLRHAARPAEGGSARRARLVDPNALRGHSTTPRRSVALASGAATCAAKRRRAPRRYPNCARSVRAVTHGHLIRRQRAAPLHTQSRTRRAAPGRRVP